MKLILLVFRFNIFGQGCSALGCFGAWCMDCTHIRHTLIGMRMLPAVLQKHRLFKDGHESLDYLVHTHEPQQALLKMKLCLDGTMDVTSIKFQKH